MSKVNEGKELAGATTESPRPALDKQWRRVVVYLEVNGTYEQAKAIQDAIGERLDDEFLAAIVTDVIELHEIPSVNWTVKGERWEAPNEPERDAETTTVG